MTSRNLAKFGVGLGVFGIATSLLSRNYAAAGWALSFTVLEGLLVHIYGRHPNG